MTDASDLSDNPPTRRFDLRYTGEQVSRQGSVPAAVLAQALGGLQRLVHLLAMRVEGRTLNKRARPSADIQQRFPVLCLPTRPGSFLSPTVVGRHDAQWLDDDETEKIAIELAQVMEAANSGDAALLDKAVPDPTYRRFMFAALAEMLPPAGSGIELEVQQEGRDLFVASRARPLLIRSRDSSNGQMRGVVTGFLFDIDFEGQRFGLYHPPTERKLTCTYDPEGESMLLEHPLDLIQVVGLVERDEEGALVRVVRVDQVLEIDASPFEIEGFEFDGRRFRANRPLRVEPAFGKDDQLFLASVPMFGIDAFAETREELQAAVLDELQMLWREYVEAGDGELAPDARLLKQSLQGVFDEISDAA